MKSTIRIICSAAVVVCVAMFSLSQAYSAGGKPAPPPSAQEVAAKEAAASVVFTNNAEIDNIKKRLELTSDPALLGFVLLLNEMGQPVAYYGVTGKITSGGKRLTPRQKLIKCDRGEWNGHCVVDAPSDEGTNGSSAPYVFFWTTDGQYIQWNGKYLYSDKPFRLTVDPIVVSVVETTDP